MKADAISPREYRLSKFQPGHKPRHCWICRCDLTLGTATVDHLVPSSHGGLNRSSNYRLACKPCNANRGNKGLSPQALAEAKANPKPKRPDRSGLIAAIRLARKKKST